MKTWKSLFVRGEEEEVKIGENQQSAPSFPLNNTASYSSNVMPNMAQTTNNNLSPETQEVMEVYEKGLDSINMPGYDFYEFYKAIQSAGPYNEQAYNMAYQMAKTMDSTVTIQKLISDAEFYISKINDVHNQYVTQGQQKLSQISDKRLAEKTDLSKSVDAIAMRIAQLRAELTQLENEIQTKRNSLTKVDDAYLPQEQAVKSKLNANDMAKTNSTSKLILVRDHIQKFIKNI
jgi:uncharacterized small protein (DUF1192 family)